MLRHSHFVINNVNFFFFSSGYSHHLGSPEWLRISFFHFVLSSVSSSFNPTQSLSLLHDSFHLVFCLPLPFNLTLSISLLHKSFHLVFCLPLLLFPGTGASNILLSTCPSSLPLTWPYHFSLFSVTFFVTGATLPILSHVSSVIFYVTSAIFTDPLTCFLCDLLCHWCYLYRSSHMFPLWSSMSLVLLLLILSRVSSVIFYVTGAIFTDPLTCFLCDLLCHWCYLYRSSHMFPLWSSMSLVLSLPILSHVSSVIFYVTGATFTDPLTCSLLILSFFFLHTSIAASSSHSPPVSFLGFSLLTMFLPHI